MKKKINKSSPILNPKMRQVNDYYEKMHKKSSDHKKELKANKTCGCFYCCQTFDYKDIFEWIDKGQTALCPKCGIDSVLPKTDKNLLEGMREYWFCWAMDKEGNWSKIC